MKLILATLILMTSVGVFADQEKKPKIQFALALDTSGSMQGLINQARSRIWSLLNALEGVTKDGKAPQVEVALLEYGKSSISKEEGHMRIISDFTLEHTDVSSELFALVTNGGNEYVPQVIQLASGELNWSEKSADFKALFVSGNESPRQGAVKVEEALMLAEQNDVLVNMVHANGAGSLVLPPSTPFPVPCSPGTFLPCAIHGGVQPHPTPRLTENEQWREISAMSGGSFATIGVNHNAAHIDSPFDERIVELTKELNSLYLPYGENGEAEYDKLINLDRNVGGSVADYIDWGGYRSGSLFNTSSWDLVSAYGTSAYNLRSINPKYLPEVLKGMTYEEMDAYVKRLSLKKKAIQKEINELRKKREDFVQKKLDEENKENEASLGEAMILSLYKQLKAEGFVVPEQ